MNFLKTTAAACLMASAVFADTGFHMGARVAGSYNMVWNVENKISTTDIIQSLGVPAETEDIGAEVYIQDMDKLSGMGVSFGLSFLYQATPVFGIQPELLFSYRSRSVKPKVGANISASVNNNRYDNGYGYGYSEYGYGYSEYGYTDEDYGDIAELASLGDMTSAEIELNQWFIDLPILFHFQTGAGVFFNLGPVVSFNLSSEVGLSVMTVDAEDYVSSVAFGAIAGLGYSFDLGNGQKVDIDFRFHMGFSSLISNDIEIPDYPGYSLDGSKIIDPKDMNLSLGIAYWFL